MGAVAAFLAGMLVFCSAAAQDKPAAGKLDFVEGDALIEPKGGPSRIAKVGEPIYQADTITTFASAEVHVSMVDGGYLSLRENTKITVTVYAANGDDNDSSLIDLAKGTIRSVTGWIGKYHRSSYQIRTPMVTIGVRGTDHEPTHIPPGDPRGEPGSYDKVTEGSTVMQSALGTVEVTPNRAAHFDAARKVPPRLLQSVPAFFRPARHEQRFLERAHASVQTLDRQRETRRDLIRRHPELRHPVPAPRAEKKAAMAERRLEQKAARQRPEQAQKKAERSERLRERIEKKRAEPAAQKREVPQRRELPQARERFEKKRLEKKRD